jgi:hypothetical protein
MAAGCLRTRARRAKPAAADSCGIVDTSIAWI